MAPTLTVNSANLAVSANARWFVVLAEDRGADKETIVPFCVACGRRKLCGESCEKEA